MDFRDGVTHTDDQMGNKKQSERNKSAWHSTCMRWESDEVNLRTEDIPLHVQASLKRAMHSDEKNTDCNFNWAEASQCCVGTDFNEG